MRSLKFYLTLQLLYLAVLFNLERLGFWAGIGAGGIHYFVYWLVVSAVVVIWLLPRTRRTSIFAFLFAWSLAYFALRLTFFNDVPSFGLGTTFITLSELAILLVAILLAYQGTRQMHKYENFLDEVYLPVQDRRIRRAQAARDDINTEFIRSRRHQHPLSLLAISPVVNKTEAELKLTVQEIQRHMINRFVNASIGKIITREARRTDMIISLNDDDHVFFILCPETKGEDTVHLAERIQSTVLSRLGISVNYGIASFPDQALTYDELVKRAENQLIQNKQVTQSLVPASNLPTESTPVLER